MKRTLSPSRKATMAIIIACLVTGGLFWSAGNAWSDPPANLSPGLDEVVKLAQAHLGDDVILAYIKNSGTSYALTADDIVYLKGQGVSQNVIAALLQTRSAGTAVPIPSTPPPPPPPSPSDSGNAGTVAPPPVPAAPETPPEAGGDDSAAATVAPAPQPAVNFDYFQQQLSPYGNWVDLPGYGQCWQPYGIALGWRPYYDSGHWVYTDAGLYWQSDYPWGAIPFHYGRWTYAAGYGWIWAPAYDYAPAWVVWRNTGGYVGWAPLPYGAVWVSGGWWQYRGVRVGADFNFGLGVSFFVFVGSNHLWEHDYHPYVLHHDDLHRVYRASVVNGFARDDHGRFVVQGFDREHLERLTGRSVVPVRHEELQARDHEVLRADRDRVVRHEAEPRGQSRQAEPRQGGSDNREHSDRDNQSGRDGRQDQHQ